jgi:hypothetical protein
MQNREGREVTMTSGDKAELYDEETSIESTWWDRWGNDELRHFLRKGGFLLALWVWAFSVICAAHWLWG